MKFHRKIDWNSIRLPEGRSGRRSSPPNKIYFSLQNNSPPIRSADQRHWTTRPRCSGIAPRAQAVSSLSSVRGYPHPCISRAWSGRVQVPDGPLSCLAVSCQSKMSRRCSCLATDSAVHLHLGPRVADSWSARSHAGRRNVPNLFGFQWVCIVLCRSPAGH